MKNTPFYHVSYSITRHVALERGERNRRHKHAFYEPCIVLSGSGEFEQNGVNHAINEGDLFIGDADTFHEIRNLGSTALELYFVCFYLTWHADKPRVMRQALLDQDQATEFLQAHHVHIPGQSHMLSLFEHAMNVMRCNPRYEKDRFYHEVTQLLIGQILAASTSMIASSVEEYSDQLQKNKILDYIEKHLREPIRVGDLALECGVSERTLRRQWRTWSGHTLSEEIIHRRVERAAQLLLLADISIAEAGHLAGMPDPAYFSRVFKKWKGCPPKEFRRRYLDSAPSTDSRHLPFSVDYLDP